MVDREEKRHESKNKSYKTDKETAEPEEKICANTHELS
jgi:hypothetical protein